MVKSYELNYILIFFLPYYLLIYKFLCKGNIFFYMYDLLMYKKNKCALSFCFTVFYHEMKSV